MASLQPRKTSPASIRALDPTMDHHDALMERIQALSQELQDMIFDFTMCASITARDSIDGEVVAITTEYKAPLALQINRKQRGISARKYYATSIFSSSHGDLRTCAKWLSSLAPANLESIKSIRFAHVPFDYEEACPVNPYAWYPYAWYASKHVEGTIRRYRKLHHDPKCSKAVALGFGTILSDGWSRRPDGTRVQRWYRGGYLELGS